jgi:outer membrane protein assembly factor BamB
MGPLSPAVADSSVYATITYDTLDRLNLRDGSTVATQPAQADGLVYWHAPDGRLLALDARTGRLRASTQLGAPRTGDSR